MTGQSEPNVLIGGFGMALLEPTAFTSTCSRPQHSLGLSTVTYSYLLR